jgi:DNA-binding PadR family transcriptional regulator
MASDIRITGPTLKVLGQILTAPESGICGAEISKATGVASGTLYPILFRLEKARWLSSEWEDVDPSQAGRPRKRLYKITALGCAKGKSAIVDLVPSNVRLVWES